MYTEFAYSSTMQVILMLLTIVLSFTVMYLNSNLILLLYNERASKKQQIAFAFAAGIIYEFWIYGLFLLGGKISFSPFLYQIIVFPNPFIAITFLFFSIWILKLSMLRSIRLICNIFLYFSVISYMNNFIGSVFFAQSGPRYNYLLDCLHLCCSFPIFIIANEIAKYFIKKNNFTMMFADRMFIKIKWEWAVFLFKTILIYIVPVFISLVIKNNIVSNFFSAIFAVMFYFISFFIDSGISRKNEIASRDSHIMALSSGISEFRRLKHDFFNILQTYGGYIEIGDILNLKEYHNSVLKISAIESTPLELSQLLPRNPPLISLLISKVEKASQMGVYLKVSITANFDDLYIDIVDLCRALACLLDNAIESACESEEKRVLFNLEKKGKYSKIIIITNSSPLPLNESILSKTGKSTKEGHSGLGVSTVRKTLEKYPNCRFHYGFFNCEVSAYIEIRP